MSAIYLTADTNSPPELIAEFDDVRAVNLSSHDLSDRIGLIPTLTFNRETTWPGRIEIILLTPKKASAAHLHPEFA